MPIVAKKTTHKQAAPEGDGLKVLIARLRMSLVEAQTLAQARRMFNAESSRIQREFGLWGDLADD